MRSFVERGRRLRNKRSASGQVEVEKRGKWFVLRGHVDSHRTRSELFKMVPERSDGGRYIVDRLRVGCPTSGEEATS
ncbi:MAG: hypothetical protein R6V85_15185 [Polyangia bacterium]